MLIPQSYVPENIEYKSNEDISKLSEVGEVLGMQYGLLKAASDRLLVLKDALYPILATKEEEIKNVAYPKDPPKENSCKLTQEIEHNNELIIDLINSMLQIIRGIRI